MGFDVDACSIGFDGSQVYMTPRCHQALVRQDEYCRYDPS